MSTTTTVLNTPIITSTPTIKSNGMLLLVVHNVSLYYLVLSVGVIAGITIGVIILLTLTIVIIIVMVISLYKG